MEIFQRKVSIGAERLVKREIRMKPLGFIRTQAEKIPRHWTVSEVEGYLEIEPQYVEGLKDIKPGQRLVVIFHFHKSPEFNAKFLVQKPPGRRERLGVFSACSPIRPNAIGMSVFKVIRVQGQVIHVKGLDTFDGTPILDIKPFLEVIGE